MIGTKSVPFMSLPPTTPCGNLVFGYFGDGEADHLKKERSQLTHGGHSIHPSPTTIPSVLVN